MAERRRLLEDAPPRRRAVLEADAPAEGVAAPTQGELDLVDKVPAGLKIPATLDNVMAIADDSVKALIAEAAAKQAASGRVSSLAAEARRPRAQLNLEEAAGTAPRVLDFVDLNPKAKGAWLPKVTTRPLWSAVDGQRLEQYVVEPATPAMEAISHAAITDLNPARRGALQFTGRRTFLESVTAIEAQAPYVANTQELRIGVTDWVSDVPPPCSGYWDVEVGGAYEGRLWYSDLNCAWHNGRGGPAIAKFSEVMGATRWRGLRAPWPAGYAFIVPGLTEHLKAQYPKGNTRPATRRNY